MSISLKLAPILVVMASASAAGQTVTHVWDMPEIEFRAAQPYRNPYTEVLCWVDLNGPAFSGRVYAFWDGGDVFRVRVVATAPGKWSWVSGSNQPRDKGLNGKSGTFVAQEWSEQEKRQNPNRHGFLRPTQNGHALQYADGAPFFLVGDTWLAASTWRLPLTEQPVRPNYQPGPGITFQEAVAWRKAQGFNSISMIAAFPTWASDHYPNTYADKEGVYYRNAWEKFGVTLPDGKVTAKDMHDERGYRPFEIVPNHEGLPDFDRVIPAYFQSLDKKVAYLNQQGFIAMLETVRRDNCPPWKAYFNFQESYARFLQYMVSRYGAYNLIFSKIHLDIIPKNFSLSAEDFNEALKYHLRKYGPMPFEQPVTALIDRSTYTTFGHGDKAPWITLHSTGNNPRDHGIYPELETLFGLTPPYPAIDLEPYFTGWMFPLNSPAGERPQPNSERDNYFSRAQMYGCVLSGGLSGHVHGTAAYDITTTGEPSGFRPYFWDALKYTSAGYMQWMRNFVLSGGTRYRDLLLASNDLTPRKAEGSPERGLDGWAFLMRTREKDLGLLYFENKARRARAANWSANTAYRLTWYNPRTGKWLDAISLRADAQGSLQLPPFPGGQEETDTDWAAKITAGK